MFATDYQKIQVMLLVSFSTSTVELHKITFDRNTYMYSYGIVQTNMNKDLHIKEPLKRQQSFAKLSKMAKIHRNIFIRSFGL
jgi:hypothetical protein